MVDFTKVPRVVDVFHGNSIKDFASFSRAGVWGVIHKASQGSGYSDKEYARRRDQIEGCGLYLGAYHFGNGDNVKAQVDRFLTSAKPNDRTLVALDFEDPPKSDTAMSLEQAEQFVQLLTDRMGRIPVLYSGNRVKDILGRRISNILSACKLWLAQYAQRPITQASWPQGPWLWQYTEQGRLPGTDGYLDFNAFAGSRESLAASWAPGLSGTPVARAPNVVPLRATASSIDLLPPPQVI